MTFIIEFNIPFQWKFGYFKSNCMLRFWWGFIAIGITKKNLRQIIEESVWIKG